MKTILLIGATGLVGTSVLKQALNRHDVKNVIALTRRSLAEHEKLTNIVVDFDNLPVDEAWWQVDAVICTMGTTIGKAGSKPAFRKVDFDYPYQVGQIALAHNVSVYVLNSAIAANPKSRVFYSRVKGELEQALIALDFPSFTTVRPSLIDGKRSESRPMEKLSLFLAKLFSPLIPTRYRPVHADNIADCLLNAALTAPPGVNIIESERIK